MESRIDSVKIVAMKQANSGLWFFLRPKEHEFLIVVLMIFSWLLSYSPHMTLNVVDQKSSDGIKNQGM